MCSVILQVYSLLVVMYTTPYSSAFGMRESLCEARPASNTLGYELPAEALEL